MTKRAILLTIKEKHAVDILNNKKREEYRNRSPRISEPTHTIMYVSGIKISSVNLLWDISRAISLLGGYPRKISNPIRYTQPILWELVLREIPGIRPLHRNFRYLNLRMLRTLNYSK